MKMINIYVEGSAEVRFFSILIEQHFSYKFEINNETPPKYKDDEICIVLNTFGSGDNGGINSKRLRNTIKYFKEEEELNQKNIVFIDADTEKHNDPQGGFENRYKYLQNLSNEFNIEFDYFIIPDNNTNGNLETLLGSLISEIGRPYFECLERYTNCLGKLNTKNIPIEIKDVDLHKKRFEWYTYNMLGKNSRNETGVSNRDYSNNDLWDLSSEKIKPILDFLSRIFSSA